MKILNIVIKSEKKYLEEMKQIKEDCLKFADILSEKVDILVGSIENLEKTHLADISRYINSEHELKDKVSDLESQIELDKINIKSLKQSNIGYKSNNSRMKKEKEELKKELASCYKYKRLPDDKSKSKQVQKTKNTSKLSSIAKAMHS